MLQDRAPARRNPVYFISTRLTKMSLMPTGSIPRGPYPPARRAARQDCPLGREHPSGHFVAMEVADAVAADLRPFFVKLR